MNQLLPPYRSLAMMALLISVSHSPGTDALLLNAQPGKHSRVYSTSSTSLKVSPGTSEAPNPEGRRRTSNNIAMQLKMAAFSTVEAPQATKKVVSSEPRRRRRKQLASGAIYQRSEMLNHALLSKREEMTLGEDVQRARELQSKMNDLIDMKGIDVRKQGRFDSQDDPIDESMLFARVDSKADAHDEIDWNDLTNLSILGIGEGLLEDVDILSPDADDDDLVLQGRGHYQNYLQIPRPNRDFMDDSVLTDSEITDSLGITRDELRRTLLDGGLARETLVACNVKLVVSIAKKWSKQTAKYGSTHLVDIYSGSWNRPSLDDVIQEGILGLATAAERYEPCRELKFSTYATIWVTAYVRSCFQRSVTGCVKVPAPFHDIKSKFKAIVKRCYENGEQLPGDQEVADEIGVTTNRLKTALRFTQPLLSLDATRSFGPSRGSQAGEADMSEILLVDTMQSDERQPGDVVELSLLRQCLENAMATELSPHERDVIRLRLGLDDGVTRTAQEIVDVCGGTISIHAVRAAEQRAYKKLRSPYAVHTRQLMSYLDFADADIATVNALTF